MTDLDTRLRETLDRVAATTKVHHRVDEIVDVRSRTFPRLEVAAAAFALVIAVFALPMLLSGPSAGELAGSPAAPEDASSTTTSPSSTGSETSTVPDGVVAASVARQMGGSPLSDEELGQIAGYEFNSSGYLIASTTTDGYELGLIVYEEDLPSEDPMTCFADYAMKEGVNVVGGGICAPDADRAAEIAEFHFGISGSCGGVPKEDPVVEKGPRTLLSVWGVPEAVGAVTVGLSDGTSFEVSVSDGVALHVWEASVGIHSIEFTGMTGAQRDVVSSYLPTSGIDCTPSNETGQG